MDKEKIEVMIVEDDELAANIYVEFTNKLKQFKVTAVASTGKQALDLLNIYKPRLILLDIFLPDMNGIDLLWEIRRKYRGIDIILITASNDAETVGEAIRGGAFSYIIKPVMIDRLVSTLDKYSKVINQLKNNRLLAQNEVDSFFPQDQLSETGTINYVSNIKKTKVLPKGIDQFTLTRVKRQLKMSNKSVNAEELAGLIGVSRSTARRYLEYLVSTGEVEIDVLYGAIGRPERRYKFKH